MKQQLPIILAIVFAGGLIALAIASGGGSAAAGLANHASEENGDAGAFRAPSPDYDYVRGSVDAPITIVEFSDFQCVFCKRLHPVLKELTEIRGDDVKWVYRHLPLTSHSRAVDSAAAAECVGELAGSDQFWTYTDQLFARQGDISDELFVELAVVAGVNEDEFSQCVSRDDVRKSIEVDRDEAIALGARGTPFGVIVTPSNELVPFTGVLSVEQFGAAIDNILAESNI